MSLFSESDGELKFAPISCSAGGSTALVAALSGYKYRVISYVIVANTAVSARFMSGSTAVSGSMALGANGGVSSPGSPYGHCETQFGAALNLNLSTAVAVGGHLTYQKISSD